MCLSISNRQCITRKTGKFRTEEQTKTVVRKYPKVVHEVLFVEKTTTENNGDQFTNFVPEVRERTVICASYKQVTKKVQVPIVETIDLSKVPYKKGRRFFWKRVNAWIQSNGTLRIEGPIMSRPYKKGWMIAKGRNKGIDGGFHVMTDKTTRLGSTGSYWIKVEVDPKSFLRSGHWSGQQCETYGRMRIPASEWARMKKTARRF